MHRPIFNKDAILFLHKGDVARSTEYFCYIFRDGAYCHLSNDQQKKDQFIQHKNFAK